MQGTPTTAGGATDTTAKAGGRGVLIAQGAWWDNIRDGMKSFDLWDEKGYGGVDVTICIAWIMS
jgi:hypothetical protein